MTAVDSGKFLPRFISAKFQSFSDHRGKVLFPVDMGYLRIFYDGSGEYPVRVAFFYRHQTVGGEKDRSGDIGQLFLLVLPCGAEIAFQMRVFFQFRISVGRKHLSMRIDVDAGSFCLFQKQLEVAQVMSADDNKGSRLYGQRNGDRLRISIGFRVGSVQKFHIGQVYFSHFHDHRKQVFHLIISADHQQRFIEKLFRSFVPVSQDHGVISVGRHAAYTEQDQGLQGSDVFRRVPQQIHIIVCLISAGRGAGKTV